MKFFLEETILEKNPTSGKIILKMDDIRILLNIIRKIIIIIVILMIIEIIALVMTTKEIEVINIKSMVLRILIAIKTILEEKIIMEIITYISIRENYRIANF